MNPFKNKYFLIIFLVAILLRINTIGSHHIDHDEWYTLDVASRPFLEMHAYIIDDVHLPLYYYATKVTFMTFGVSEFSLRLPAVLFGIAGIVVFFMFLWKFFGKTPAYLGTSLLAVSGFHVAHSLTARMYSLLFLLTVLAMYFLYDLLEKWDSKQFFYLIVVNILLFYTHIFAFFFFIFVISVLFVYNWRKAMSFGIYVCLSSIPVFLFYLYQAYRKYTGESHANWMHFVGSSPKDIYYVFSAMSSSYVLSVAFITLFILFIVINYRNLKFFNKSLLLLLQIVIGVSIPLFIHFFIEPMYALRYFMIVYPAYLTSVVLSLTYLLKKKRILTFVIIGLIFFFTLFAVSLYQIDRYSINVESKECQEQFKNILDNQNDTLFVTTRWLNDWHPGHRPTTNAFDFYAERFNQNFTFINEFGTTVETNYSSIVIMSPMIRNQFFNDSGWFLLQESSCRFAGVGHDYGFDYRKYVVLNN